MHPLIKCTVYHNEFHSDCTANTTVSKWETILKIERHRDCAHERLTRGGLFDGGIQQLLLGTETQFHIKTKSKWKVPGTHRKYSTLGSTFRFQNMEAMLHVSFV